MTDPARARAVGCYCRLLYWVLWVAMAPTQLMAATFTVDTGADFIDANVGDGVCSGAGSQGCSLRAAVMEANASAAADSVFVPAGMAVVLQSDSANESAASGDLDIHAPLNITQFGGGNRPVIRMQGASRIFDVHSSAAFVTLSLLVLRDGQAVGDGEVGGGAILNRAGNQILTILGSELLLNSAHLGAAIFNEANLEVTQSALHTNQLVAATNGNTNARGSAIFNLGQVLIDRSAIYFNDGSVNTVSFSGGWRNRHRR